MSDDAEIRRTANALAFAHPHPVKMRTDAIVQAFISLANPSEDLLAVAQEILANHTAMRMLSESEGGWHGRPQRYIPPLRTWLYANGRDPVQVTPPAPPGGPREY